MSKECVSSVMVPPQTILSRIPVIGLSLGTCRHYLVGFPAFLFREDLMDCFRAAAKSVSGFTTCAGAAMCDSRPNHACSSARSATVKRPSFLTGIPSRAHRCAVAGGRLRNALFDSSCSKNLRMSRSVPSHLPSVLIVD
jgi:hypothetical protein